MQDVLAGTQSIHKAKLKLEGRPSYISLCFVFSLIQIHEAEVPQQDNSDSYDKKVFPFIHVSFLLKSVSQIWVNSCRIFL